MRPNNPARKTEIAERRKKVGEMTLRGVPQDEQAELLGVSRPTIQRDLAWVRAQWIKEAIGSIAEKQAQHRRHIEHVRREAAQAWERSKQDAQTDHVRTVKQPTGGQAEDGSPVFAETTTTERTLKGQAGDPRFLEILARCAEQDARREGILIEKGDLIVRVREELVEEIVDAPQDSPPNDKTAPGAGGIPPK